jgi:hypothetical protein
MRPPPVGRHGYAGHAILITLDGHAGKGINRHQNCGTQSLCGIGAARLRRDGSRREASGNQYSKPAQPDVILFGQGESLPPKILRIGTGFKARPLQSLHQPLGMLVEENRPPFDRLHGLKQRVPVGKATVEN